MSFYAYMLRCVDYSYYVGHTDNLEHRIDQQQVGEIAGYTQNRRPVRLVWAEDFATREEAIAAERQLKGWSRAKKEALILENWDRVKLLAGNRSARTHAEERSPSTRPSAGSGRTDHERSR